MIISGAFKFRTLLGALSIWGVILGVTYMVWLYYRVAMNAVNPKLKDHLTDLDWREVATLVPLVALALLIGLQPESFLGYMHVSVAHLIERLSVTSYAMGIF